MLDLCHTCCTSVTYVAPLLSHMLHLCCHICCTFVVAHVEPLSRHGFQSCGTFSIATFAAFTASDVDRFQTFNATAIFCFPAEAFFYDSGFFLRWTFHGL